MPSAYVLRIIVAVTWKPSNGPYVMEVNSAGGTVPCDHIVATNLTLNNGGIHSCASLVFEDKGGNSGWDMNHEHQHCN